jgi:GntR family transcriptional regulator
LENTTLTDLMDMNPETSVYRRVRRIEAVPADKEDIKVLGVKHGDAIQKLSTVRYSAAGDLLDMSYAYYRGDMNSFEFDVTVSDSN